MELLTDPNIWIAFFTLFALEVVLGIDNIVFISILVGALPKDKQEFARMLGLSMAMLMRIALLFAIAWIMKLVAPLFTLFQNEISGRDLILIIGGLFLIAKSTFEIHKNIEPGEEHGAPKIKKSTFFSVLVQILILDLVFSLDSVITAIGMVEEISVMVAAIICAVIVMMFLSGPIAKVVEKHPTLKILALSFLILIGVALMGDGLDFHIPKGYIYFAMSFSLVVELLNMRIRRKAT